ncbi:MAG: hypothetical protein GY911_05235 [Actinomycetales bacterium]|nr:hypothetical protein [Actinomycetales bacterium]
MNANWPSRCPLSNLGRDWSGTDCNEIFTERPSLTGQGLYSLDPSATGTPVLEAICDFDTDGGGWTVIDLSLASSWSSLFTSWAQWTTITAGPDVSPDPSYESWRGWFGVSTASTEFRTSTDCLVVDSSPTDEVWRMTGNFFGCTWWNGNCNMASDGSCSICQDNLNQTIGGTCSHMVGGPDGVYPWACFHWWNSAPSLGTGGQWCVAYRTP